MMKKLLFSALLVLAVAITASSQPCTPGPYISPGIYPDTITNLPTAYVNLPYGTVVTVVIPVDTNLGGFDIPIDSIGIVDWSGYPAGFIYTPNTATGFWPGGSSGCVLISGTPTIADTGLYHLVFYVDGYVMGSPVPMSDSALGYKILVKDTALGVPDNNISEFTLLQNTPNPFSHKTKIEFTSPVVETYKFSLINVIGEEVYSQSINAVTGKNIFEFSSSGLPSGIYLYKLGNKTSTITRRMIIEK
ncbi:MAG: T9SS type A sorting domain-containing protein [Bacteroidota bacterium]